MALTRSLSCRWTQLVTRHPEARTHLAVCGVITAGTALAALHPTWLAAITPACTLRRYTGVRCPFCGMTTDFLSMWHGHLPRENPFSPLMAILIYIVYPSVLVYTLRTGQFHVFSSRRVQVVLLCVVGVMWAANNFGR